MTMTAIAPPIVPGNVITQEFRTPKTVQRGIAAGVVMRPAGGALFGWIGDRYGRKQALIGSVMAMAFPSFLVAFLPDAASIGLLAPVLLILLRLIQGIAV